MSGRGRLSAAGARLIRVGRVVESDGAAVVRFTPECTRSGSGCRGCATGRAAQIPLSWLEVVARDVTAGEPVVVEVDASALTRVAATLFGAPLAALLGGAWLGTAAAGAVDLSADLVGAMAGLMSLMLACAAVIRYGHLVTRNLRATAHRVRTDG